MTIKMLLNEFWSGHQVRSILIAFGPEELLVSHQRVSVFPGRGVDLWGSPGELAGKSWGTSGEPLDCSESPQ